MGDSIPTLVRGVWIFYTIGMVVGFTRIIIRTYLTRRIGLEETIMFVSMLFWTGDSTLSIVILQNGTNQVSDEVRATLTPDQIETLTNGSKALITAWFCYITMIWGLKTCLLIFYRKLMLRVTQVKLIHVATVVLAVTYGICILSMFLVCRPFRKNWQVIPDPGPQCTDGYEYVWIVGICNIITDAMLLGIPIPVVLRLHISVTQKAMLCALFGSAIFVIIATILRIHFTIGGDIANLTFWCMIETTSAMIVVNAPGIVSIFTKSRSETGNSYELKGNSHSASRVATKSFTTRSRVDKEGECKGGRPNSIAIPGTDMDMNNTTIISSNRQQLGYEGAESQERIILPGRSSLSNHDNQHMHDIDLEVGTHSGLGFEGGLDNKMVIHQKVTYEVTAEQLSPTRTASSSESRDSDDFARGVEEKGARPGSRLH